MKSITDINKAIMSIKSSGAKLDALIQDTAVSVAEHFAEHKDTGLVNRLFLAMPQGGRKLALADWLMKFVAVKPNTEKASKAEQPFLYDNTKTTDAVAASAVMWYDLKKEKAVDEAFDVTAAFKVMLKKIERSTQVEHFDRPAIVAFAKSLGIAESDVPTKPGAKAKAKGAETIDLLTQ